MSFTVTLDDIKEAAEKRFGNVEVPLDESTVVVLRNPLRLSDEERAELVGMQDRANEAEESEDQSKYFEEMLLIVADSKTKARRLIDSFNGDLTEMVTLVQLYQEHTQMGEASPSQD